MYTKQAQFMATVYDIRLVERLGPLPPDADC